VTATKNTHKTLPQRIVHALHWRTSALLQRLRKRSPQLLPVLIELRAVTGRGLVDLGRDVRDASRMHGVSAHDFANLILWEIPKERWREYIVGDDLERFLKKTLDPEDRVLSRDKAAFAEHDRKKGLPWLATLAVINRREGVAIDGATAITSEEQLWRTLAQLGRHAGGERALVVKPSCGERGKGFFRVTPRGTIHDGGGIEVDRESFASTVLNYTHRLGNYGYLVQPALRPHPDIVRLTGVDSLASARVVVALKNGVPHIVESFLKIPGSGRLTDNFLSGSKGTTLTRFDPETGRLTDVVGLLRPGFRHALERSPHHPVTGRRIAGEMLPSWREVVEISLRASHAHPRSVALGWDIAITDSSCVILDGNPNWGPGWQPCAPEGVRALLARLYPDDF
jgi:hypothetical protein